MKKIIKLLLATGLLFTLVGCSNDTPAPTATPSTIPTSTPVATSDAVANEMTLEIIILDADNETELFNDFVTVNGEVETLYDFLALATDLQVVMEEGEYGNLITSILGLEQNMDKGPWWLYESTTNQDCVAAGMCSGVDDVRIVNNDKFTFKLTSTF